MSQPWWKLLLIEGLAIPGQGDNQRDGSEETDGPDIRDNVLQAIPLDHDAADDAQKVRQRQNFANYLRPARHAAKWKGEPGKEERRQEKKERQLHGLKLVLSRRRKGDTNRQVGA